MAPGLLFVSALVLLFCTVQSSDLNCQLSIIGDRGSPSGIQSATLKCEGGELHASGHALLAPFKKSLQGVSIAAGQSDASSDCLLSFHGNVNATFRESSITGVPFSSPRSLLCIDGSSSIVFEGLQLNNNVPVGIRVGDGAKLTLTAGSQLRQNHNRPILAMGSSEVLVTGRSSINGNICRCNGAGILATDNSTVHIAGGSTVSGNRARPFRAHETSSTVSSSSDSSDTPDGVTGSGRGGGIYLEGTATVIVTEQSSISGNVAAKGGAFAAAGGSSLTISDSSKVDGNIAVRLLGGGIFCTEQAKVAISKGTMFIGNQATDNTSPLGTDEIEPWEPSPAPQPAAAAGGLAAAKSAGAAVGAAAAAGGGGSAATTRAGPRAGAAGGAAAGVAAYGSRMGSGAMPHMAAIPGGTSPLPVDLQTLNMVIDPSDPSFLLSSSFGVGGGAIAAHGTSNITISKSSRFDSNVAVNSSGGAILAGDYAWLSIGLNTTFVSNVAQHRHGGAVMLKGAAFAVIRNSSFANNTAYGGVGGAIAAFWKSSASVAKTEFHNNTAFYDMTVGLGGGAVQGEGGALYAADYALLNVFEECIFKRNSALRGYDASVGPRVNYSMDLSSGRTASSVLWMKDVCDIGEVRRLGWCEKCRENHFSFSNLTDYECRVCPPNAICTGGDVLLVHKGYWRSSAKSTQLHACPNPDACLYGGDCVEASGGHLADQWRDKSGSCCAEGYKGRLCGVCDTAAGWGQQKPFKCGKCKDARSVLAVYVIGAVVLLALITYIVNTTLEDNMMEKQLLWPSDLLKVFITYMWYLLIVASIRLPWHDFITAVFQATGVFMSITSSEVMSLDCLLSTGGDNMLPLAIRKQLVYLLVPVGMFCAVVLLQLLLRVWQRKRGSVGIASKLELAEQLPVIAMVVVFFFHVPLCQLGLSMFACTIRLDVVTKEANPYPQYEGLLSTAAHGYWVYDMEQACYEGWHKVWAAALGLPCVLLFCVLLPAGTFVLLYRKRGGWRGRDGVGGAEKGVGEGGEGVGGVSGISPSPSHSLSPPNQLQDPEFQKLYGSLYRTYREERYYWEAVVAVQTVILASISVFSYTVGVYYATLLLNAALGAIILMQLLFKPFPNDFKILHKLQLVATGCLLITSYAGLSFLQFDREVTHGYIMAMCILMALLNVAFTIWCCFCIWRSAREIAAALTAAAVRRITTFSRKSFKYVQHRLGMHLQPSVTLQQQASAVERGQVVVVHADEFARENGGDGGSPPSVVTCTGSVELSKRQSIGATRSVESGKRPSLRRTTFSMPLHSPDVVPMERIMDQDQEL